MAKRKRNYKQEYRRRKARGERLGISRSAARGHARVGERTRPAGIATNPARARKVGPEDDEARIEPEGRGPRESHQPGEAAPLRPREHAIDTRGESWQIIDLRRFHLPIYSRGQIVQVWLSDTEATKAGEYLSAVGRFLPTGDASILKPFVGDGVRDTAGDFHPFETGPEQPLSPR